MKINKYFAVPLFTAASFLLSAAPALALEPIHSERAQNIKEFRCNVVENRVKIIVGQYDVAYPRHVTNYKRVATRVAELVTKLKADGKDTTNLEAVLKVFNDKILTFDQQTKAVIAQLNVAQQYACGESQGQYATEIKKARDLALTAHATLLDIRAYYQSSVRPAIQALRTK